MTRTPSGSCSATPSSSWPRNTDSGPGPSSGRTSRAGALPATGRPPVCGGGSGDYASRADTLLTELHRGDPGALARLRAYVPRCAAATDASTAELRDARLVIARELGFPTWRERVRVHRHWSRCWGIEKCWRAVVLSCSEAFTEAGAGSRDLNPHVSEGGLEHATAGNFPGTGKFIPQRYGIRPLCSSNSQHVAHGESDCFASGYDPLDCRRDKCRAGSITLAAGLAAGRGAAGGRWGPRPGRSGCRRDR